MRPLKLAVSPAVEESLDPQDWSSLRSLGHQMVDDMLSYLETVRERTAWQPMPAEVRTAFETPLPRGAGSADRGLQRLPRERAPLPSR